MITKKNNTDNRIPIILLGCGGHAKSIVDAIEAKGKFKIAGFIDRDINSFSYRGYSVIGQDKDLQDIFNKGITHAFVCIGYMGNGNLRESLFSTLRTIGYKIPSIIDPSAILASDVQIGIGTYIGKNVVINSDAQIGNMCIINTATVIEHDCKIDNFTHVAVGCILCGNVTVGTACLIGANSTIIQEREIKDNCIIGAGSVITKNIESNSLVIGRCIRKK